MIWADYDENGFPIGIGRFQIERDLLPGAFYVKECFVCTSYACISHKKYDEFEILCDGDVDWIPAQEGQVPSHTVVGGRAEQWENLHIGKVVHCDKTVIGKVHRSHRCLYIPWGDAEYKVQGKYLHLIDKNSPKEPERTTDRGKSVQSDYNSATRRPWFTFGPWRS